MCFESEQGSKQQIRPREKEASKILGGSLREFVDDRRDCSQGGDVKLLQGGVAPGPPVKPIVPDSAAVQTHRTVIKVRGEVKVLGIEEKK